MKPSNYTFILNTEDHKYWYNVLSHSFFRLSKELGEKIEHLYKDIDNLQKVSPSFYKKLIDGRFIIEDEYDELNEIRKNHHNNVHKKDYFLIILPTLNCNYKCWYCIQDHIPSAMSDSTMEAVKRHIDYMIDVKKIDSLHLEWFGGEPFMLFNKVIIPVSNYAIKKCEAKGIPFENSATTNGYFISPKISNKLTDLKFSQFQITLDGEKKFHDDVKFTKGCVSTFEHVLENINHILEHNESINIILRINYTHTSLTKGIVDEVNNFISSTVRKRITIVPKKVWQENSDKSFNHVIIDILDLFSQSGYGVERWHPNANFLPCYVNSEFYNTISYNGHAHKCTACDDLYEKNPKGVLMPNGIIEWKDDFDRQCQQATFENERCLACKILPVCMGLCPRDFISGKTYCKYDHIDEDFETTLLHHLIHQYD